MKVSTTFTQKDMIENDETDSAMDAILLVAGDKKKYDLKELLSSELHTGHIVDILDCFQTGREIQKQLAVLIAQKTAHFTKDPRVSKAIESAQKFLDDPTKFNAKLAYIDGLEAEFAAEEENADKEPGNFLLKRAQWSAYTAHDACEAVLGYQTAGMVLDSALRCLDKADHLYFLVGVRRAIADLLDAQKKTTQA